MGADVRLLGGLRVVLDDGGEVAFPTRKAAALLALLATDLDAGRSRDAVAAMLWPWSGESQARASLRQTLTQLRKALAATGSATIESAGERVRLDPGDLRIDVAELRAGDPARAVEAYAGPFLGDFGPLEEPFDAWVRDQRHELQQVVLAVIERRLAAAREAGRPADAVQLAERALTIDATWEVAYRALLELHLAAGRRSEAVKVWERCRSALQEELGVAPNDEIRALIGEAFVARGQPSSTLPEAPGALPRAASIAVLPFDNLSDDPEQGYFADGIAEDIITELSRFKPLAVMARNSSFAYRGHTRPVHAVVADLGVSYVLEGSVRRAGRRLRITAQLIDGQDATHVWADRYDVDLDAMFEVQDEITRSVAGALALNIEEAHLAHARHHRPEDLAAYDLWLRGMECMRRGTPGADEEARQLFERALEIDPRFARAYAGISLTYFNDWSCQAWDRWDERERGAFEAAQRAVELDDGDHLTHTILGRIYGYRRQHALADKHFERALALNPNDPDCLLQIAFGKSLLGQHERAHALADTALRRQPKHGDWYYAFLAFPLFMLRRYDEMITVGEHAPEATVDTPALLAAACALSDRAAEARRWADKFRSDFQAKITFGREPEPGEPVRWIFHVNPWRLEDDREHVRRGLALAGLE